MKSILFILLVIVITAVGSNIFNAYMEKATVAECESILKDIVGQLQTARQSYGNYKSGLEGLKYREIESCHILKKESEFNELAPQFHENDYTFYFMTGRETGRFGKVILGKIIYLE